MAIDLKKITRGRLQRPHRSLLFGPDGVGKTSYAAGAPKALFIDANRGSGSFDVHARVDLYGASSDAWDEMIEWLTAVEEGKIDCQTVVIDSATEIESMAHAKLFGTNNTTITDFGGGYGKGEEVALAAYIQLLYKLERLWDRGKNVIILAHAKVKTFKSPDGPNYDRWQIACREGLSSRLRSWSDYVFFAQIQTTMKDGKAIAGNRVMWTRRTPAYDAKARGTSLFPEILPLSYEAFVSAVEMDGVRAEQMREEIKSMLVEIGDAGLTKQVSEYLKKWPAQVSEAHNRVQIRLAEKRSADTPAETTRTEGGGAAA
jgi:hypothetical protein